MALTLANLKVHVTHALGGGDPAVIVTDAATTKRQIINEAGRILCAEDWNFLNRAPTTLNFAASTNYVALPSDLAAITGYALTTNAISSLKLTTLHEIVMMRSRLLSASLNYYAAISYPTQTSASAAPGAPRLELWPTPPASVTGAITLFYRAGWTELSGDTDVPNIPTWAEGLLVSLVRAVAVGYEEDRLQEEIAKVTGGPLWVACRTRDGMIQPDFGVIAGGAVGDIGDSAPLDGIALSDP